DVATRLVELGDVLAQQRVLALGRDVPFHGGKDLGPELLAHGVVREECLVRRVRAGGGRGNPECRGGNLKALDVFFEPHRLLRSHTSNVMPWRENGNDRFFRGEALSAQWCG